jgi:hypothetical protein
MRVLLSFASRISGKLDPDLISTYFGAGMLQTVTL